MLGPAQSLFARTIQRGIDRGEFHPAPLNEMTVAMFAPMMFLCLHKHSLGACHSQADPAKVLATHIDVVLTGLLRQDPADDAGAGAKAPAKKRSKRSE